MGVVTAIDTRIEYQKIIQPKSFLIVRYFFGCLPMVTIVFKKKHLSNLDDRSWDVSLDDNGGGN
jgi:hypothetical protein